MEFLETFLISIGGTATALLVIGFLSKSLIAHLFNKEMETYKSALSHDNAEALENLKAELASKVRDEERAFAFESVMRRYKGPLLHAVYDLQSRLYNIISQGFVEAYYRRGSDSEREYVVNNTVFLIAQYFAWTEIIRREIQFIELAQGQQTQQLSALRDNLYGLWQTDGYHDHFRVWAGEQRAIGELMIEHTGDRLTCMGYAAFLATLDNNKEPLFTKLQQGVESLAESQKSAYPRLKAIQHALMDTLNFLDPDGIRFPVERRTYVL